MIHTFFTHDIEADTKNNDNFRKVIWTGTHMQLVYMAILSGGDIGEEVHNHVDQFFRIEAGEAKAIVGGEEFSLGEDSTLVVPAGSIHNIINTGTETLKLYTIYSPPNHIDQRVHSTRADADLDVEDEDFGHVAH